MQQLGNKAVSSKEEGQERNSDGVGEGDISPICHFAPDPSRQGSVGFSTVRKEEVAFCVN